MKHSTSMARAWPICCAVLVGLSPVGAAFANGGAAASRQSNAVGATAAPEQTGRQHGGGATYYLDQLNGSDQNRGTRDQPWKTLANLGERVFMPGDRILFARGTSFHGGVIIRGSGTENARIVLGAYQGQPELRPLHMRYADGTLVSFELENTRCRSRGSSTTSTHCRL